MISSMTGFGAAALEEGPRRVSVEVRTVNHRYLKVVLKLPRSLLSLEGDLEGLVRRHVGRGAVNATVHYLDASMPPDFRIDAAAVRAYRDQAADLARTLSLPQTEVGLGTILGLPGAILEDGGHGDTLPEEGRDLVFRGLTEALTALDRARAEEGEHLRDVLSTHGAVLESLLEGVARRAPAVPVEHRDRLLSRVRQLLADLETKGPATEPDLLRELCLLADRSDVTEELNRLRGHLARYRDILAEGGEAGRRIEFLLQEMLRETNTIGAKANDPEISHAVVDMKCEIERMKEQVQNLE